MKYGFPFFTNTERIGLLELLSCQLVKREFVVAPTEMAVNVASSFFVYFLCIKIELCGGF